MSVWPRVSSISDRKTSIGRPATRWTVLWDTDNLCMQVADCRSKWSSKGECLCLVLDVFRLLIMMMKILTLFEKVFVCDLTVILVWTKIIGSSGAMRRKERDPMLNMFRCYKSKKYAWFFALNPLNRVCTINRPRIVIVNSLG